jgi:homoserine dehydrogenase
MNEIGIGLLGFGTVGAGVVEGLQRNGDLLTERIGVKLVVRRIADVDVDRDRGVKLAPGVLTRDAGAVIDDPSVHIVVELIGGTTVAKQFILQALRLGKPVVTANKALLAEHGEEIFACARAHDTDVWFEASVAGGVPIIRALRDGLVANHIDRIYGILNGTCNYILTRMDREQMTFEHALKEAQAAGFAEADPGLDIDGYDTAHKAAILASLAYGVQVPMNRVYVEGIRGVAKADIEYANGLGYRIKLLAVIKSVSGSIEVRVHPTLVPVHHMIASVSGVFNTVLVEGDIVGQTAYYGRGAGRLPTASAVISDVADVARRLTAGKGRLLVEGPKPASVVTYRAMGEIISRYYLRLSLLDRPGILGQVTTILGQHGISIASVLQKETHAGKHVPVIIVTDQAREEDFERALRTLDAMESVGGRTVRIRIEDLAAEK